MRSFKNSVQLIGNIGNAPEVKEITGGKTVAKFSIATNESYKAQNGEFVKTTSWHNIVAWGNTAKYVEKYLEKGKEICLEGRLTTRTWEDNKGEKHYITEIIANEIMALNPKK